MNTEIFFLPLVNTDRFLLMMLASTFSPRPNTTRGKEENKHRQPKRSGTPQLPATCPPALLSSTNYLSFKMLPLSLYTSHSKIWTKACACSSTLRQLRNWRYVNFWTYLLYYFRIVTGYRLQIARMEVAIQNFLEVTLALADEQHVFRQRRSCLSQLLNHYDEILRYLEEGHNVDTIFLNFSRHLKSWQVHSLWEKGDAGNPIINK